MLLNRWLGTFRWTYNQALAHLNANGIKDNLNLKTLRAAVVNNETYAGTERAWVLQTPYDVRDEAVRDLIKAYTTNFAKKKKQPDMKFWMRFKSKKRGSPDSLLLHGKHMSLNTEDPHLKSLLMFPSFFSKTVGSLRCAETLPMDFNTYDCRLIKERTGKFFLCIPRPLEYEYERTKSTTLLNQHNRQSSVIALDPGVRTFLTGYSPSGEIVEMGSTDDMKKLRAVGERIDRLQSVRTNTALKTHTRYNMKRRSNKLQQRIKDMRSDAHRKIAKLLVTNFGTILLPKFETSQMVENQDHARVINSETVRRMLTWSHYAFQQLLVCKAREAPGCKVLIVDEAYTTKTCGQCGNINNNVGASKAWICPACNERVHRDWAAARNIFLKNAHLT